MSQAAPTQILTFSEQEQKNLATLQENCRIFKNMVLLFQNGSFKGSEAQAVSESIAIATSLYNQSEHSIAQLKQTAANRPATSEKTTEAKKEKKTLKAVKTTEATAPKKVQ